jgi:hypothetical protein
VTRLPDFHELVGEDLPVEERERLQRVHDLLVAAGPPPELPPALERVPNPEPRVIAFPQRRRFTLIGLAAALAAATFVVGYVSGGSRHGGFTTQAEKQMHGTALAPAALATIRIAARDEAGNWPMRVSVSGLRPLPPNGYYELYLSRNGKPAVTCGTFIVHAGTTVVALNAPYPLKKFDGWVVTRHLPGTQGDGPVLMTT